MAVDAVAWEPNMFISNGTCYSGPNLEADQGMIPCGNAFYGPISCCQAGDSCLMSGACFNGKYWTTYVAGCTDPEYNSTVCPDKFDDKDAPWLGMSYCNGTSNEWVLCDQKGHPGTLEKPDPCYCPKAKTDRTMTLSQLSTIGNTASLPTATGLSVQFMAGYYPTAPPTSSSTPTSTSSSPPSSALVNPTAAAASPSEAAPSPQDGLSRSATVGAAVGASVGGLIVLALCLAPLLVRRRRCRRREAGEKDEPDNNNNNNNNNTEDPDTIGVAYGGAEQVVSPHPSELEAKAARPWSMVSELEGDGAGSASPVRMEAIMEQGWGRGEGGGADPSELPAHHVAELPA